MGAVLMGYGLVPRAPRPLQPFFGVTSRDLRRLNLITPSPLPPADDLALVARILRKDAAAFGTLVDLHHGSLLRLANAYVKNTAAAEEVVQETWLAVLTGLPGFQGRAALKTWIFNILVKRARTKWAREARSLPFSSALGDGEAAVDPSRFRSNGHWAEPPEQWDDVTPEKLLLDHEARVRIDRAIAALPDQQRLVITLRDLEGLESSEVCAMLEVTEQNQRVLLHRARSKVRAELETYLAGGERLC